MCKLSTNTMVLCDYAHMDWSNLEYFLAVAKEGSLSSAAKSLKVNHSTVARRIDRLESDLNVRLFRRHNKGYLLTEHGLALEQETKKVDQQIYQIQRVFKDKETELSGKLVVSKPASGGMHITPLIAKFLKQYPNIDLDINVVHSDDVDNYDADISLVLTNHPAEHMIGTDIGSLPMNIYGADSYLRQTNKTDIEDLDWIIWKDDSGRTNMEARLKQIVPNPSIIMRTNSFGEVFEYLNEGVGVSMISPIGLPASTHLKPFREDKYSFDIHLWLLSHPDLRNNAKVQVFKKFFLDEIQGFITNKISKFR